jgi:hypothetical protein
MLPNNLTDHETSDYREATGAGLKEAKLARYVRFWRYWPQIEAGATLSGTNILNVISERRHCNARQVRRSDGPQF